MGLDEDVPIKASMIRQLAHGNFNMARKVEVNAKMEIINKKAGDS